MLLASIAMNVPINLVFEDFVWSTSREGVDFAFPMIIWTAAGAVACRAVDPDSGTNADVDTSKTSDSNIADESEERVPPES